MKRTTRTDINYGAGGGFYPNFCLQGHPFKLTGTLGQRQASVKW
jgi:alpha-L-fucosidase 2